VSALYSQSNPILSNHSPRGGQVRGVALGDSRSGTATACAAVRNEMESKRGEPRWMGLNRPCYCATTGASLRGCVSPMCPR
jgi:hypothetical protein